MVGDPVITTACPRFLQGGQLHADPLHMVAEPEPNTARTGPTLRRARELACLDLTAGARALDVRRSELRSIERGRRAAGVDLLERAVRTYGDDGLVLPPRQDLLHPVDPTLLVVGDEMLSIGPEPHDDERVLADYVAAVRRQRRVALDAPVPFRAHDLVQLAGVLDLASPELERQLGELARLPSEPAHRSARCLVLTGLCLAVEQGRPPSVDAGDGSWLARDRCGVGVRAPSTRFDEIEQLMAEFRSAT